MGRNNSFLKFPKKEEQLVPDSIDSAEFFETNGDYYYDHTMDDQKFEGIKDEELGLKDGNNVYDDHDLDWNFMDFEEFSFRKIENDNHKVEDSSLHFDMVKRENCEFWDELDEAKKMCLNLSLNYQDVMDAWSDRGSLWAEDCSPSPDANNYGYMGEVPIIEEVDRTRREASVLRYKEKRQNRLFAKKIRYQVRKLNADNRPRLKGRFVKRES